MAALPGSLYDAGVANIINLLGDIHFTQTINAVFIIYAVNELRIISIIHILDVQQPIVDESARSLANGRSHAATAVMAANDDVLNLKNIHRILNHRQAVKVSMYHKVGNIAVHKQFTGQQANDLVGRYTTVGTTNPQVLGLLLVR